MSKDPYGRLVKNSAVFAVANISSKVLMTVLIPYYTYVLTTAELGLADTLVNTVQMLLPLLSLGIQSATLRFAMDKAYNSKSVFSISMLTAVVSSMFFGLTYPLLSYLGIYKDYLFVFYIMILVQSVALVLGEFARATGKVKQFALSGVIQTFVLCGLTVLFLSVFKLGVVGYLLAYTLSYAVVCVFLTVAVSAKDHFSLKQWDKNLFKTMLKYSIPLIPNSLMWWLLTMSDRYMIIGFIGVSAAGIYAVANKIPTLVSFLSSIFYQAGQLSVIQERDSEEKNKFYSNVFNTYLLFMLLVASGLLMICRPAIDFLLSADFKAAADYIPFLLMAAVFSSFSSMLGTLYAAAKYTRGAMYSTLLGAAANIGFNLWLIPTVGLNGAAFATMFGFIITCMFRVFDTRRCAAVKYDLKMILPSLALVFFQVFSYYQTGWFRYLGVIIPFVVLCVLNLSAMKQMLKRIIGMIKNRKPQFP